MRSPERVAKVTASSEKPIPLAPFSSLLVLRDMPGLLSLILHAHLPFVRHPEHERFLEEDWFFEAITECYIPLVRMMQRLVDDHVPFRLAMSLTPTLCAMLQDKLLRERYVQHLDLLIDLAAR